MCIRDRIKVDQMVSFGSLFPPIEKWVETLSHKTSEALENDIWVIDWATTDHVALRVGYSGAPLGHITRASTSTEGESINLSITLAAIVCVVAAQQQLAALGTTNQFRRRDESDEIITSVFV